MTNQIAIFLKKGIENLNKNNLEIAENNFKTIIDKYDNKNFQALNGLGVIEGKKGNHKGAKDFFLLCHQIKPNDISINFNLANALVSLGSTNEALYYYDLCNKNNHNHVNIFINHAKCLFQLEQFDKSLSLLNLKSKILEKSFEYFHLKALIYKKINDFENAINSIDQSLKLNSANPVIWNLKGLIFLDLEYYYQANTCFKNSLKINPNFGDAYINLGILYRKTEIFDESIEIYKQAIKTIKEKNYLEIFYTNISNSYLDLNGHRFGEDYSNAIKFANEALLINNKNFIAKFNLALSFLYNSNFDKAANLFEEVINFNPNYAPAHRNLGVLYNHLGLHEKSEKCIKHTLKLEPSNKTKNLMLAESLLSQNKFEEAWEFYEHRWINAGIAEVKKKPNFSIPEWAPSLGYEDILIWGEQGLGDQILFSSILPDLTKKFKRATLLIDKRLCKIMKESIPNLNVKNISEPIKEAEYKSQISLCSLARYFRKDIISFSSNQPFLKVNNDRFFKSNQKLRCAISWKSKAGLKSYDKSATLESLQSILTIGEIEFYNIQYSDESNEVDIINKKYGNIIKKPENLDVFNDIYGLLQFLESCDLVISTSNSNVHLSGAIGKPTYLLVPKSYGRLWYWDNELDGKNLWYPSVRKFSQKEQNNWVEPIKILSNQIHNDFLA